MSVKCGCVFLEVDGIILDYRSRIRFGPGTGLLVKTEVLCGGNLVGASLFHLSGSLLNKSFFQNLVSVRNRLM